MPTLRRCEACVGTTVQHLRTEDMSCHCYVTPTSIYTCGPCQARRKFHLFTRNGIKLTPAIAQSLRDLAELPATDSGIGATL